MAMLMLILAGAILGLIFYGGLWMTVQRLAKAGHPAGLVMGSFLLRTGLVLGGVALLSDGRWEYALLLLVGFTAGRLAFTYAYHA